METKNITLEKKDHIAYITIDHPPANAWDLVTTQQFSHAIEEVEQDKDIRVLVLTGRGEKFFSAGFDVTDVKNADKTSPMARALWTKIDRFTKPVIAAINGHAMGGGLELALCCHFRIMADDPSFRLGLTELNLGIIPGWGGTQRLARVIGRSKALEMILFSKTVGPSEALELGLVNKLAPPDKLMNETTGLAQALAERPPVAVHWVLKAMSAGLYQGLDRGLEVEAEGSLAVRNTKDREEGFKAFMEKRKPIFKGE
ncbi:MAG: enoyl-CoA hydratase [Deltaproteobacteria bacterium]|nr:MAG: enoyl-CoA hydratase [Deltaproteobacteria bacterium]